MPSNNLSESTRILRDLRYARAETRDLLLDLYLPEASERRALPLIVWVHGGAWRMGSKNDCREALPLLDEGCAIASVGYRLSDAASFPAQIRDCKAAVRWLRQHAAEYHLDPQRFGTWGPSAGGHLVSLLGVSAGVSAWDAPEAGYEAAQGPSSAVQAVCDWFGPSDFTHMNDEPGEQDHFAPDSPESQLIGGPVLSNLAAVAAANPITYLTSGRGDLPPFLICHGDQDRTVPPNQSVLLQAALSEAGGEASLMIVPGAGHGFQGWAYATVLERVKAFFRAHLEIP